MEIYKLLKFNKINNGRIKEWENNVRIFKLYIKFQ